MTDGIDILNSRIASLEAERDEWKASSVRNSLLAGTYETELNRYRDALERIIKHNELFVCKFGYVATTVVIAKQALEGK